MPDLSLTCLCQSVMMFSVRETRTTVQICEIWRIMSWGSRVSPSLSQGPPNIVSSSFVRKRPCVCFLIDLAIPCLVSPDLLHICNDLPEQATIR